MALRDAIKKPATQCKVARAVAIFNDEDIETLTEWVEQGAPLRRMVGAIRNEYPENSFVEATLSDHLRGRCGCPEKTLLKGVWENV